MSTPDKQKTKKRKNRRAAKSVANSATTSSAQISPAATTSEQDFAVIQRLMDAEDGGRVPDPPPFSRGPNPYLGGERCLLCRCERPDPPQVKQDLKNDDAGDSHRDSGVGTLSQLPLWVCPDCRKTVEEEEKKAAAYNSSLLEQDLRLEPPTLPFLPELAGDFSTSNNSVCTCEACTERRQIEAEHEKETQELQQCWMELRHVVRCIYREAGTGLASENQDGEASPQRDTEKIKELVHRLCARDAHQLYQRLESQGREYVIEMKVRLLKQLTSGHKTPVQAKQFVSMLLEEYSNLCAAAKSLASFLGELETEHLKRFNLTWELHNKHLFQSIIYSDPFVQNSLPMLIAQLRSGAASKESYHEDTYPNILHRYLKFDDEMSVISVVWRDCQQLLETYNDEQAALRAKQKMLKEDWEFFKAQRRLLEQQVLKKPPTSSSTHNFEAQFTETMRHILQGTKPAPEECQCPNCNKKRYDNHKLVAQGAACTASTPFMCPCEECTLSHMIKCGIISPDGTADQLLQQHDASHSSMTTVNSTTVTTTNCFSVDASPYMIDVTPPSMSSTNSSSGSSSPINVDPKRLVLPFDVCPESFELAEDEIPEEIEDDESLSDSDRGDGDENEGDDEAGDDSYTVTTEYQDAEEALELTSLMDNDQENNDTSCGEGVAEYASMDSVTSAAPVLGLPTVTADAVKTDCGCTHCTRARLDQQKPAEEVINQCQCHACMVQSGKNVPTCLPHVPTAPRAAAFHLYPHIHGSNCLQTAVALHGHNPHVGPVLQSHLYEYELHTPTSTARQPKSLLNPQKKHNANFSLDLDSHEALHEHIYHAYGEWDNAYDSTKLMLSSHKYVGGGLGSELFSAPPPPLMNGSPFVNVGDQLSTEAALSLASAMKTSVYQHNTVAMNSPLTSMATSTSFANTSVASTNGDHIHTEACFKSMKPSGHNILSTSQPLSTVASRSVTSGCGAVPSTAASAAVATNNPVILTSSAAATSTPSTAGGTSTHNDHCLKHNPFLHTHHASFTSTHATTTISASPPLSSHQLPVKLTPELIRSAAINAAKEESARSNTQGTTLNMPHTCSHQHNPVINPQLATNGNQPFIPPNPGLNAGLPTLNNITVSLPTPGVCNDPDCDGHHDAEYDSIDDSCSEQSSSTSTSNQKDGKYCDCCYCEFFGHSNPPQAPTSRNYAEIRDRLRLRLKKKGEQKTEEPRQPPPPPAKEEVVDDRGLEELVRYINGEEKENKSASAKAAKRARQKQKKAEERAKREAEMKAALEQERMHQEHRRALAKAMEDAAKQQKHLLQHHENRREEPHKKKKSKMKEISKVNDENRNPCPGKDHNKKDSLTHAKLSDAGCSASAMHAEGKCASRLKSLSKRGEADGCQTPSSVTTVTKEGSHHHGSAESSSGSKGSAQSSQSSNATRMGLKADPRPEKIRKGKGATPALSSTHSGSVCLAQKAAVQSQSQEQTSRSLKTPPQGHQQQPVAPPPPPPNNQHPRGRIGYSNGKVNDFPSQKSGNVTLLAGENSRNNRKTCENNRQAHHQGNAPSPQHQSHKQQQQQQQILNNNNNPRKGERVSSVNGTQTPPAPTTPVQQRKITNNPSQTAKCPSRSAASSRQNAACHHALPTDPVRNGSGDGLPSQMVNGNLPCAQEIVQNKKSDTKILKVSHQVHSNTPKLKVEEKAPKQSDQSGVTSAKPKKNKRKNKSAEDLDEIFMPRDLDPDNGEIDELDREIEEFKRFCLDSTPMPKQEKLQVNMNLKDIFNKKKSGVSCA